MASPRPRSVRWRISQEDAHQVPNAPAQNHGYIKSAVEARSELQDDAAKNFVDSSTARPSPRKFKTAFVIPPHDIESSPNCLALWPIEENGKLAVTPARRRGMGNGHGTYIPSRAGDVLGFSRAQQLISGGAGGAGRCIGTLETARTANSPIEIWLRGNKGPDWFRRKSNNGWDSNFNRQRLSNSRHRAICSDGHQQLTANHFLGLMSRPADQGHGKVPAQKPLAENVDTSARKSASAVAKSLSGQ